MRTGPVMACLLASVAMSAKAEQLPAHLELARNELQRRLQHVYPEVTSWTVQPMVSERQLELAGDAREIQIDAVKLGRRSAVQLSWREGGQHRRQATWFDVSGEQPGVLIAADVKRNETIRMDLLRADRVSWMPGCGSVSLSESLQSMRSRKALRAGDSLCAEDLEPKPPVSRGERVLVQSQAGLVTVTVSGIAEQDGNIGDRLQVRDPSSGASYVASVAAEGEVIVRQ